MIKVGITGGIGSGKTTVCEVWKSLGAYVINADDVAKILMTESPKIKQELIETFGKKSYHSDGSLNRTYLAQQAFEKGRVKELNAIVHPYIPKQVELLMQDAEDKGVAITVYEAALLLQNVRPEHLDKIVLVLSDKKERIDRVQKRDDVERELVLDRINKQQNFDELKHLADIIIRNNGTLDELKEESKKVYQQIVA